MADNNSNLNIKSGLLDKAIVNSSNCSNIDKQDVKLVTPDTPADNFNTSPNKNIQNTISNHDNNKTISSNSINTIQNSNSIKLSNNIKQNSNIVECNNKPWLYYRGDLDAFNKEMQRVQTHGEVKWQTVRVQFLKAFQFLGGWKGLATWARHSNANLTKFYELAGRMLPQNVNIDDPGSRQELLGIRQALEALKGHDKAVEGVVLPDLPDEAVPGASTGQDGASGEQQASHPETPETPAPESKNAK